MAVRGLQSRGAGLPWQQTPNSSCTHPPDADEGRSQDLLEFASKFGLLSASERKALKLVDFDATDVDSVGQALGGR